MSTAILTGASKGIGKAITEDFLGANTSNNLVAVARDQAALEALQNKYGKRVAIVVGDVSDALTASRAVETAIENFGVLNSIIANAGVLLPVHEKLEQIDLNEWRKLFEINYFAVISLVQAALPQLRKSKGNVVVVSLSALDNVYSGWYAYGNSKAAINLFVQYLGETEKDVQAISIEPGVVDTGMQKNIRDVYTSTMSADGGQLFHNLSKNNHLLPPAVPAHVYSTLAIKGWAPELDGKYFAFNDNKLAEYQLK